MLFFNKPVAPQFSIPPLIVNCVSDFSVCGSRNDISLWLKPVNVERSTSFVVYDPDGSLRENYGRLFRRNGYSVKVFNPANFNKSVKYNPFAYIHDEQSVINFVTAIMAGTNGWGKRGDLSFLTLESVLLTAFISFVIYEAPSTDHNFSTVLEMLNAMEPYKHTFGWEDDDYKHAVDLLFEDAENYNPNSLHVEKYRRYKETNKKRAKAVVKSCIARLSPFGSEDARKYFSFDELCLNQLYEPRTALFVKPDKSGVFDFIVPLMYTQLFDELCKKNTQY